MYQVKDQNGDTLDETDSWAFAMNYMSSWLPAGADDSYNGAGIWDTESQTWQYRFYAEEGC